MVHWQTDSVSGDPKPLILLEWNFNCR